MAWRWKESLPLTLRDRGNSPDTGGACRRAIMGHACPEGRPGGFRDEACLRRRGEAGPVSVRLEPVSDLCHVTVLVSNPGVAEQRRLARQTFVGGCRYSWTMWIALMALLDPLTSVPK
jgi:hypothetical protein